MRYIDIAARPRPSFTRGIGSTLDVVGMGDNRIGTHQSSESLLVA